MAHEVSFGHAELEHGAQKYQAGTPDVAGPVGLSAAVSFFERAGREALNRHDEALARHGLARLREIPGLRLIGPTGADWSRAGLDVHAVRACRHCGRFGARPAWDCCACR